MSAENPFGPLFTASDLQWLADRNLDIDRTPTPQEKIITEELLTRIKREITVDSSRYLVDKVASMGIEVKKEPSGKSFVLSRGSIMLLTIQGERRTKIEFPQNPDMGFDLGNMYQVFLKKLPQTIFSEYRHPPSDSEIINGTTVTALLADSSQEHGFILANEDSGNGLEELMKEKNRVKKLFFQCYADNTSYSLIFPNLEKTDDRMGFSFPSMRLLRPETLDVLLSMHKDYDDTTPEHVGALTNGINIIREGLRIR